LSLELMRRGVSPTAHDAPLMSSGFGHRPNPPPLLRYASCAAELTPASEVAFKQISRKCWVVCTAERSKGGGFGLPEAGGHERRSAYPQSFASPSIPNYKLKGQPNKRRVEKMSAGQKPNRIPSPKWKRRAI